MSQGVCLGLVSVFMSSEGTDTSVRIIAVANNMHHGSYGP